MAQMDSAQRISAAAQEADRLSGVAQPAHGTARAGTPGCARRSSGSAERPRLAVKRSSRHILVQLIDDLAGHTLASASTLEADVRAMDGDKKARAAKVGELVAARAREAGVTAVVFDRGGYDYHGRIAALADAAREGGLEF